LLKRLKEGLVISSGRYEISEFGLRSLSKFLALATRDADIVAGEREITRALFRIWRQRRLLLFLHISRRLDAFLIKNLPQRK
jgi:hypothetical protein